MPAAASPRAWTATTIDAPSTWYYSLPESCVQALLEGSEKAEPTQLVLTDAQRHTCQTALAPVREAMEAGRGFAVLEGPPPGRVTPSQAAAIYWLVGQLLGSPFEQNVQGTRLYDVRDYGKDVAQGARFSVTNAESTFHTDNSFGERILDYVGLLCLQSARSGGLSQLVSGYAVHDVLAKEYPAELELLYRPYHIDRRGGVRPGEAPTVQYPIIARQNGELLYRYLRYWIEVGQEKVGQPLTPAQKRAFDVLDEVANRRELRVEFMLQPGQMLMANNRWTLHNRTSFEDHPEPERRRHLLRLWIAR